MKCDNRPFQRRQDQRSRQQTVRHVPTMAASSLNSRLGPEDMQIDAVRMKTLTPEERKRRMEEGSCLYCGEEGQKVGSCPKKQNRRTVRIRGAFVQENEESSHNRSRAARQSYATTKIRFLSFRPSYPLFYDSSVFCPSETRNLSTLRCGGIGLFLRRRIC